MRKIALLLCAVSLSLPGQSPFYTTPVRVLGQEADPSRPGQSRSYAPNRVEGREFWAPQSVALDTTVSPPILYVADTLNNRVLAWRNAIDANGAKPADLVIGQPDLVSTGADYPTRRTGLQGPSALAVDASGNLYVMDAGNHRILRFPKPFQDENNPKLPNAVIGQENFDGQSPNRGLGAPSATTLSFFGGDSLLPGALLFDPAGNLYVTDTFNNRVLRYEASELGKSTGIAASIVIGQSNLESREATNTFTVLNRFNSPLALAMDPSGNYLFVADRLVRVVVFRSGFLTGQTGIRVVGTLQPNGQPVVPPNERSLGVAQGLTMIGNDLVVVDTTNNRILRFPPVSDWPAQDPPAAKAVIGQSGFTTATGKAGLAGVSLPMHAVFSGSELFVADTGNNRVMVFPQDSGTAARVLGQLSPDYNGVNIVEGHTLYLDGGSIGGAVALDTRSNPQRLYVSDTFNHRVLGFCDARNAKPGDAANLVIGQPSVQHSQPNYTSDGANTRNDTNLSGPTGLAVDTSGNLFVADLNNGRVLRFPNPCANPGGPHRANLVLGQADFTSRETTPGDRFIGTPYGLALMPEGHLLVSDPAFQRVVLFRKPQGADFTNGQRAATVFGQQDFMGITPGDATNRMRDPRHIAVDSSGRLYVADYSNRRILVFADVASAGNGTSAALVVTRGFSTEGMTNPHGIAVDQATGEIWVTTLGDGRRPLYRYPEYVALSFDPGANLRIGINQGFMTDEICRIQASGQGTCSRVNSFRVAQGLGLALDGAGKLYVTEQGNRLSVYVPPAVATDGANFVAARALAPAMIATLWPAGGDFYPWYTNSGFPGIETQGAPSVPLPRTLGDTQVLFNGQPVPLFYTSSGQINFQVPKNAPQSGTAELAVVKASTGEILAAGNVQMNTAQPALFTREGGPFPRGQVAAVNNDDKSCNGNTGGQIGVCSATRPVKRGEFISLYLTGHGMIDGLPEDGAASTSGATTPTKPRVAIGTTLVEADWSGPAPDFVGLWQLNVRVPDNTPPGSVLVGVSYRDITSMVPNDPRFARPLITVQ